MTTGRGIQRQRYKFAEPISTPGRKSLEAFFWRVRVNASGCWEWTGSINYNGYGQFRQNCAHRWSYAWFVGVIPERYEIDHLCRVRACVNPAHLEAVTVKENQRRSSKPWTRGECLRGHKLTPDNIYVWLLHGVAQRTCRKCRMVSRRRWINRKAAA